MRRKQEPDARPCLGSMTPEIERRPCSLFVQKNKTYFNKVASVEAHLKNIPEINQIHLNSNSPIRQYYWHSSNDTTSTI
jgi:hypothetical protein